MSELTLTLLRLGYLALLWILVLAVVAVIRRDLFGTRITRRSTPAPVPAAASPAAQPKPRRPEPERPAGPRALVVTEGSLQGTTIALGQAPILIGRAPECTLVLEDDYVSGRHARFSVQQGVWVLEDLGSTNGTFLGRAKVEEPTPVEPGTPVRIGRTVLELRR
jgi:pSer/pThr/pTyr-binding forkhead associated (FHA) protein